jgi:CopA family copper-resistance protein
MKKPPTGERRRHSIPSPRAEDLRLTRRGLLRGGLSLGALGLLGGDLLPAWARSATAAGEVALTSLSGTSFRLAVGRRAIHVDGREGRAITVNGTVPAPLLRWRQGDTVTLEVTNEIDADTSIHWHGILLPPGMDGVPGVSFPGIKPRETFTYRFPVRQAGTYWYHSHSGLQEQSGHYGPLIIDPAGADPVAFEREYVVVLADWTFADPDRIFARLKKMSHAYNFQRRTVGDFFRDASRDGMGAAIRSRAEWAAMRMSPTDIADVTGATYTYLINGHGPGDNWTALFTPGERVRLRIINASAMTIFNVRIPGLPMSVVQSDGLDVRPVEVDELQIGVAETYDVVVEPEERAYTLVGESIDRSGMARATLTPHLDLTAEVPPLRERPLLTMKDMGMDHGSHGGHGARSGRRDADSAPADTGAADDHEGDHGPVDHGAMDHGSRGHGPLDDGAGGGAPAMGAEHPHAASTSLQRHDHPMGPGVAGVAESPTNRLGEPGAGLEDVPHRVLVYTDLVSLEPNPDTRAPERELELHLTSNMERYMWSFDGRKLSEVVEPIVFQENERLRLTMVNDTMMPHPIHLHGMFFDVVTGQSGHESQSGHEGQTEHKPRKHTLVIKPGEKCSVDITADAVGDWAFHCHLLYHMQAGMFRVVSVRPRAGGQEHEHHHHG